MKTQKIISIGFLLVVGALVVTQLVISFQQPTYNGSAESVYVEDDIAYIADNYNGLVIMDVSNPSEPYELGRLDEVCPYSCGEQIYVYNNVAYLLRGFSYRKISLIDVSDPSNPNEFSEFGSLISGMYVDFPLFYLSSSYGDFWIYNFSNPLSPTELSHLDLPETIFDIYVSNNIAYITDRDGLKTIDVSNSSNPIELGQYNPGDYYRDCVVEGHIAYVTGWPDYVDIIDVSNPSNPTKLSQFDEGGGSILWSGMDVLDDTLYIGDLNDGLELIDVSNPSKPSKFAQFHLRSPVDVFILYPYAYVACEDDGLKIVNISNPSNWRDVPSILNFTITIVSIVAVVSWILLKLILKEKDVQR